jgi:hypothetical protein
MPVLEQEVAADGELQCAGRRQHLRGRRAPAWAAFGARSSLPSSVYREGKLTA